MNRKTKIILGSFLFLWGIVILLLLAGVGWRTKSGIHAAKLPIYKSNWAIRTDLGLTLDSPDGYTSTSHNVQIGPIMFHYSNTTKTTNPYTPKLVR